MVWYSMQTLVPKLTFDLDPWTASWTTMGLVSPWRGTFSCSARVTDMRTDSDPELISARPLM